MRLLATYMAVMQSNNRYCNRMISFLQITYMTVRVPETFSHIPPRTFYSGTFSLCSRDLFHRKNKDC